jgi:hypothetical protein
MVKDISPVRNLERVEIMGDTQFRYCVKTESREAEGVVVWTAKLRVPVTVVPQVGSLEIDPDPLYAGSVEDFVESQFYEGTIDVEMPDGELIQCHSWVFEKPRREEAEAAAQDLVNRISTELH